MPAEALTPLSDDALVIAYAKRDREYPSFCCDPTYSGLQDRLNSMQADRDVTEVIGVFTLGFIRGKDVKYALVSDDDGHWYVCPANNRAEAEAYFEAVGDDSAEEPAKPEWLTDIDGPHRLTFTRYTEE